jgi:hypothetical protein
MKIGDTSGLEPTALTAHPVAPPVPAPRARPVEALEVARAFVRLVGRIDDDAPNPARAAQVEILRSAVAAGRYRPDPLDVARKLVVHLAAAGPRRKARCSS